MSSALESEDLENVPLVRMEDVQPSRTYDLSRRRSDELILLDTCVIEDIEYDNECIVNDDDDSNIGSMVSIQSEEVVDDDSEGEPEMIVPEMIEESREANVLEPLTTYQGISVKEELDKPPSSWPTLEILPGGVIKKPEHSNTNPEYQIMYEEELPKPEEMMYACAKCPQRFKLLFCLVKHVKWHEDEAKKLLRNSAEIKPKEKYNEHSRCAHTKKRKMMITVKPHKKKTPKKTKS